MAGEVSTGAVGHAGSGETASCSELLLFDGTGSVCEPVTEAVFVTVPEDAATR